jgi:hypothetical protein
MRSRLLFCALFAAAIVLLAAVTSVAFNPRGPDRHAIVGYNPLAERMLKGTVASNGYVIEGLLYFPLRTADATVEVQLGPKDFVERSGFKLNTGDMVTVIGMPVMMMNRQVVLTREVTSASGVLTVRDQVGLPLWEREPVLMDPVWGHC